METRSILNVNQTLHQALAQSVRAYPDRDALVVGADRLSYRECGRRVEQMAAALSQLGIGAGDKVALILPNCSEAYLAFFATSMIGAVTVPMNIRLTPRELQRLLSDSEAAALITVAEVVGRPYYPMIHSLRADLPRLQHLLVKGAQAGDGIVPLEAAMAAADPRAIPHIAVAPDDVATIFYTSGTTGEPKGAMRTHKGVLSIPDAGIAARGLENMMCQLVLFPLFHIGAVPALGVFVIGGKLVALPIFDPQAVLAAIQAERVTTFAGVPQMFYALLRVPDFDAYDLSSLRRITGGAAPFSAELIRTIEARFGKNLYTAAYGSTEVMSVSFSLPGDPEEKRLSTVGLPAHAQSEVKIVDEERRELPVGVIGEVVCRNRCAMKGYYNRPEATAETIDAEGWVYTGDLGRLDEQGYLQLVGRKRDMIKRGGEAIFPAEIEDHLMTHPEIQLAAVIGLPDPIGGELVRAYVQPLPGATVTESDVFAHCRGQIATYKIPQEVRIVDSLPVTASGKIQKFKLREAAMNEGAAAGAGTI